MGVVVPPGFGQIVFRFGLAGDPEEMITTCGVDLTDAGGAYVAAANNINVALLGAFPASGFDSDWTIKGVRIYVGQDDGSTIPYDNTNGGRVGTSSDTGPVQNTALLVQKRSNSPGRRGRGRMYWPPFMIGAASYSPAGVLTTGTMTALSTKFADLFVAINGISGLGNLVLFHADGAAPTPLVAWVVQQTLATQRQRLRR